MDAEVWDRFRKAASRFFGRRVPAELEAEISDLEEKLLALARRWDPQQMAGLDQR